MKGQYAWNVAGSLVAALFAAIATLIAPPSPLETTFLRITIGAVILAVLMGLAWKFGCDEDE